MSDTSTTEPAAGASAAADGLDLNRRNLAARTGNASEPAPVRIAHLGLGAFHRAHQAWYTDVADEANEWGIAAFTGRSPQAAEEIAAQDGLYALLERSVDGDSVTVVDSISEAVDGARVDRLVEHVSAPATALVTLTVTEAGYALDADGRPDLANPAVDADVAWLRRNLGAVTFDLADAPRTALARLLTGVEARRRAGAGALAIVSCDNLPENGELTRSSLFELAELAAATAAREHLAEHVTFVSTSIDRITPKTTPADVAAVTAATGWRDRSPVVTEPFHDWVLSGEFRAGRPAWEKAGARFVDDIDPFERRKLWLLNGSHTLLAYAGAARGHRTVAEAVGDAEVRSWVEQFWDEAVRNLPSEGLDLDDYRAALLDRFDNARIQHLLRQIGQDGTTKLRVRVAPVLRAERAAGRGGEASVLVLGAWVAAARDGRLPADRAGDALARAASESGERAVVELLRLVDPELLDDATVVAAVGRAADAFAEV
ncbi:mannitol dehydrogenase family protein [Agromyces sp. SYSU K20354]|uniref:mannitol dehydrogenase family protein n=1 Tax=Agromyces cavernae TaxID=2898659 RepID=UPI001E4BFC56|nr:mannitol dehydrogenase family protein [Agromyces cavernae]MCD2442792.1 mannitol dehydrogenase family protein [Agromyces cavernae]